MKKIFLIAIALMLFLTGCGKTSKTVENDKPKLKDVKSIELTDEYYDEHWPGVTKLVWINDTEIPSNVLIAMNNNLYKADEPYVIKYKVMDVYSQDYQDQLVEMKNKGESVAIFNIGGIFEGENRNVYKDAIDKGLLDPLNDYLEKDSYGQQLYECFEKKQWEDLEYKGNVYSYDFRRMPVGDLCAYVNEKYIEKYKMNITEKTTLTQLFEYVKDIENSSSDNNFYPIIWDGTESDVDHWENAEFSELMKKNKDSITCYQNVDWEQDIDFGLYIRKEDFVSTSDTELMVDDKSQNVFPIKKIMIEKDCYEPIYNCLTGVASWASETEKLYAKQFITMANCNTKLANTLQYGLEGENWYFSDGKVNVDYERRVLGEFSIGSKWLTYNSGIEPTQSITKKEKYKNYIHAHMQK